MHFSEREKEIIKHIDSGEIHDLHSYLEVMVPLQEAINTGKEYRGGNLSIPVNTPIKTVDDEAVLARELNTFMALCKKLDRFQLLQTLDKATYRKAPTLFKLEDDVAKYAGMVGNIFEENSRFEIVAGIELAQFIENGYLTTEEIYLKDERGARIAAQRVTIFVAVAISVMTAGFNAWTYTTDRKVSITNLDAIKYPISVSISDIPKQIEVTKVPLKDSKSKK